MSQIHSAQWRVNETYSGPQCQSGVISGMKISILILSLFLTMPFSSAQELPLDYDQRKAQDEASLAKNSYYDLREAWNKALLRLPEISLVDTRGRRIFVRLRLPKIPYAGEGNISESNGRSLRRIARD